MRHAIPANIKLAATIRFLDTGACYADLQHLFRIPNSTLSKITPEVCDAIYEKLKGVYLKVMLLSIFTIMFKNFKKYLT